MLRLIVAAAIAYILIPEDLTPRVTAVEGNQPAVSASQTLDAANSVLQDIGDFCTRNPEACETGRALIETARQKAQTGLDKLSKSRSTTSAPTETVEDDLEDQMPSNEPKSHE